MTGPIRGDGGPKRSHFILNGFAALEPFRSPGRGRTTEVPRQNRRAHSRALTQQLNAVAQEAAQVPVDQLADIVHGFPVEFEGFPGIELAFESLARERSGIELLNVRKDDQVVRATVFVPEGKLEHFENVVRDYAAAKRGKKDQALDHRALVDTIASIRFGSLRALWTDLAEMPRAEDQASWWEVWLTVRGGRDRVREAFAIRADAIGLTIAPGQLAFPERTVILVRGTLRQMKQSIGLLSLIAEIRAAKETAAFFDELRPDEQATWVDDFLRRCDFVATNDRNPHVCLLDSGVNNQHPLLSASLGGNDMHTVEPGWGTADEIGHGTEMAGLALLGDLTPLMTSDGRIIVDHRLESVKVVPHDGANGDDARHHGFLTVEAVSRPEVTAPQRRRAFALAVSARDNRDRGRPSAWSAAIDRLAADADGERATPRLIAVCAGNADLPTRAAYPDGNTTDGIHDPGQAWNALTVGSATNLVSITEEDTEGYEAVAGAGGLSPFSTTSATWDPQWPLKPDVLFEGGNVGRDNLGTYTMPSLSLLTAHYRPNERVLTTTRETSASTALGARMAAQLMVAYPNLSPESIRALIVHSASWTREMRRMHLPARQTPTKAHYANLIRHCGFGIPNLERAMWSASNSLSLIVEEQLRPFERKHSNPATLREMHLHSLPWPSEELESLSETIVEMRVTLSYFIEPNPSARGRSRYAYQSHGLRFDVKRPDESVDGFRSRVNRAARDEEEGGSPAGDDPGWTVGKQVRHRGSIHSDIWTGTATDLASRGVLAVYPALGWWKTRLAQQQYDRTAPYTLIVSIHAPETEVDLYAAIENKIVVETEI